MVTVPYHFCMEYKFHIFYLVLVQPCKSWSGQVGHYEHCRRELRVLKSWVSKGDWGHAFPENFENVTPLKHDLQHFWTILVTFYFCYTLEGKKVDRKKLKKYFYFFERIILLKKFIFLESWPGHGQTNWSGSADPVIKPWIYTCHHVEYSITILDQGFFWGGVVCFVFCLFFL